mmetsp:Transcript_2204/g.2171  ORF Transcript_2204/g.2171 Transcript_2204/m.2171 type:complete len:315 (-) Transcript_2204:116-1060(-)
MSSIPLVLQNILLVVGSLYLLTYVYDLLIGIYNHFIRSGKNIVKRYGTWSVITGATDGIGKAMAFELARKGSNILLISRTLEKLEETKKELNAKYPKVTVEILDIDFSKYNETSKERITSAVKSKDVGVLINNVGISYPFTRYFHELDDISVEQLITLNVNSTTNMTRIVLPGMLERKRGAIVNIGSAAGVSNSPLLAQYGAAKSYIAMFSKVLNKEYRSKGIDVQCQVPMFVATKLAKLKKTSLFVASPSAYARAAVASIGYDDLVSPYWSHALQIWLLTTLPEWISAAITMSVHQDIRKKGFKKESEKPKQN